MARVLVIKLAVALLVSALFLTALSVPLGPLPPLGGLLEPFGGFWTVADEAVPAERRTLDFPALEAPVDVFRDQHAVPHVFAQGELDLFRAVGYLQASDRLFQMDAQRRAATGTLAEVLGPTFLAQDEFIRTVGLGWAANITLAAVDAGTLAVLDAFAAGVNAFIHEAMPDRLPLEFKLRDYQPRPWEPLDSIAFAKLVGWILSGSFEDLELQLFVDAHGLDAAEELFPLVMPLQRPIIPDGALPISPSPIYTLPRADVLRPEARGAVVELLAMERSVRANLGSLESLGSNNWVIAPHKSATGRPILANDPHLDLSLPSLWYEMRLSSPSYDVYGVTLAGAPPVVLGFNKHVAWGFTNVGADVVDFYVEEVNPTNQTYRHRGEWKPLTQREEVIKVRGGAPATLVIAHTVHGPILSERGQTVAMRWTGHEPTNELRALINMGKSQSAAQFRDALVEWQVPAQNIVYADAAGNIGIVVNGLYPLRAPGHYGRLPADGTSGDSDWVGYRDMRALPEAQNPPQGFLVSANQMPTIGNAPYLGWRWADRYRGERIHEVLEATASLTVEDVKTLQLDHFSVPAREFVPFLLAAHESPPPTAQARHAPVTAMPILRTWNFEMDVTGQGPTLYWMWLHEFREGTFRDEWGEGSLRGVSLPSISVLENLTKNDPASPWFDDVRTPQVETRDDIIRSTFSRAFFFLEDQLGLTFEWGRFHMVQLRHLTGLGALSSATEPRPGGSFTVDVAHGQFVEGGLLVTSGPSWRMVVELGGTMTGYGVFPGGQSGNPVSPHYLDLFHMWMRGEYQTLSLSVAADWEAS